MTLQIPLVLVANRLCGLKLLRPQATGLGRTVNISVVHRLHKVGWNRSSFDARTLATDARMRQ